MDTKNLYAYVKLGRTPDPSFLTRSYFHFEILDLLNIFVSLFLLMAKLYHYLYDKIFLCNEVIEENEWVKNQKKHVATNTRCKTSQLDSVGCVFKSSNIKTDIWHSLPNCKGDTNTSQSIHTSNYVRTNFYTKPILPPKSLDEVAESPSDEYLKQSSASKNFIPNKAQFKKMILHKRNKALARQAYENYMHEDQRKYSGRVNLTNQNPMVEGHKNQRLDMENKHIINQSRESCCIRANSLEYQRFAQQNLCNEDLRHQVLRNRQLKTQNCEIQDQRNHCLSNNINNRLDMRNQNIHLQDLRNQSITNKNSPNSNSKYNSEICYTYD